MPEIRPYKGQVYEVLKGQHNSSKLFFDTEFPADYQSLHPSGRYITKSGRYVNEIVWRRPKVEVPDFCVFCTFFYSLGVLRRSKV